MSTPARRYVLSRFRGLAVLAALLIQSPGAAAQVVDDPAGWAVIGQQGLVRYVLVPTRQAKELVAYQREIARLCQPERTCFLNFYTNTQGLPAVLPLPDGIAGQATATFRRSAKNGAERFWWSCSLHMAGETCF
jgi:hypothetical protein